MSEEVVCFCGTSMVLKEGKWGHYWACPQYPRCDGMVGCHKGTTRPRGTPAGKKVREARIGAHAGFDPLWRDAAQELMEMDAVEESFGFPASDSEDAEEAFQVVSQYQRLARKAAYRWLSGKMGIPGKECHIGMMDWDQCDRIIEFCGSRRLREGAVGEILEVVKEMEEEEESQGNQHLDQT